MNIIKDRDLPWSGGGVELALCLKHLFGCTVYQCASRRISSRLKPCGFEARFRSRRCGYVVGLASRRAWEVGGGSLSAAGQRRWFKSEDAAEQPRPPLRRDFGEPAEDGCPAARSGFS